MRGVFQVLWIWYNDSPWRFSNCLRRNHFGVLVCLRIPGCYCVEWSCAFQYWSPIRVCAVYLKFEKNREFTRTSWSCMAWFKLFRMSPRLRYSSIFMPQSIMQWSERRYIHKISQIQTGCKVTSPRSNKSGVKSAKEIFLDKSLWILKLLFPKKFHRAKKLNKLLAHLIEKTINICLLMFAGTSPYNVVSHHLKMNTAFKLPIHCNSLIWQKIITIRRETLKWSRSFFNFATFMHTNWADNNPQCMLKCKGPDKIHPLVLKLVANMFSSVPPSLLNLTLLKVMVPFVWSPEIICPIFKIGDCDDAENHRPDSVKSTICKVLEL